jgi:hypothetical protein
MADRRSILTSKNNMLYCQWQRRIAPGKQKRKTPGSGAEPQRYVYCTLKKEKNPFFHHALTLNRSWQRRDSLTYAMISITHFRSERKNGIIVITAQEHVPCPRCEGPMYTRGTCRRKAINSAGKTDYYQLRVLKCRDCGRTHRELPAPLVPYKRYNGEAIVHIATHPESAPCNARTISLVLQWLKWFISYAKHIQESQSRILSIFLPQSVGKRLLDKLSAFVRLVANSGNWLHNRTDFV